MEMLATIEVSLIGTWVRETTWAFPTLETLHFFGLCLLLGSLTIVDIRLLGFAQRLPVRPVHAYLRWAAIGFSINITTGALFFAADPFRYFPNIAFRMKMLLVLLAGLNALWFKLTVFRDLQTWTADTAPTPLAKIIAGLSLLLWVGVIICGRMIPYTG